MNQPSLSVFVPNYNHARYLPRCLNSILRQSRCLQEIIVLDDASTDDSLEILDRFAREHPIIRVHRNGQNLGVTRNVNHGIDLCRGDYVCGVSADDEVLPGFFEKSIRLLAQHGQAGLCCTIGDWREREAGVHWYMGVGMTDKPAFISPQEAVRLERRGRFFIPGHTAIYRRDALIRAGKLISELRHYSDWFSTTVIAMRHGICVVPEPLAVFHIESNTYYQRNRRNREINEAAIEHALKLLTTPAYSDVAGLMQQSGALYICGLATLRVLLRHKEYRPFLTPTFLRKVLWHAARVSLKRCAPAFLLNWYVGIAGYRARTGDGKP